MTNIIKIKETIRIGIDQIDEIGESHMDKITEVDQGMNKAIGIPLDEEFRGNMRTYYYQNFRRQNNRGGYRGSYRNENYERGRGTLRERQYQGSIRRNNRSNSNRSRSGSKPSTNRDRIRCHMHRECNYFTKDCLKTKIEKETDQIQQMLNLDEEKKSLKH